MFYGLELTQNELADKFYNLIKENLFPNTVLFEGQPYSSKMFAANCISQYFNANMSNTIIISNRAHRFRLLGSLALLKKNKDETSLNLFKNSVLCYLKQYNGALLELPGADKKKFNIAFEINELLHNLDIKNKNELDSNIEKISDCLTTLIKEGSLGDTSLNINHVRMIKMWAKETDNVNSQKTVIIEGIENSNDSANNALLKLLEEPPESLHIIIISQNKRAILPTILSRLRCFHFPAWAEENKNNLLKTWSINLTEFSSMDELFMFLSGCNIKLLKESSDLIINDLPYDEIRLISELEKNNTWPYFYNLLYANIVDKYLNNYINLRKTDYLLKNIKKQIKNSNIFNQTSRMTYDYITFKIKEVLKVIK